MQTFSGMNSSENSPGRSQTKVPESGHDTKDQNAMGNNASKSHQVQRQLLFTTRLSATKVFQIYSP